MNMARMIPVFAIVIGLVTLYQNCAGNVQFPKTPTFEEFAFDSKADTLAYMSCSEMGNVADPQAYFTFRLGAMSTGLKLTNKFQDVSRSLSSAQKIGSLQESSINGSLQLEFSMRRKADLEMIFDSGRASSPQPGLDFQDIFPLLSQSPLIDQLIELPQGERLRFVSGVEFLDRSRFYGSMNFAKTEMIAQQVRNEIASKRAWLTLSYLKGFEADHQLLAPKGTTASSPRAYGLGYELALGAGGVGAGHPTRVIAALTEISLLHLQPHLDPPSEMEDEPAVAVQWKCPKEYIYTIVRSQDVAGMKTVCNRVVDLSPMPDEVAALRRVLPVEKWHIDIGNRCIIPAMGIAGDCYGPLKTGNPPEEVEYNLSQPCGTSNKRCAHFVSVCLRK